MDAGADLVSQAMASERVQKLIEELKEYARLHNLKQTKLAELMGIKPQQLNDWFQGHREPTADKVLLILEVMKTKPARKKKLSEA